MEAGCLQIALPATLPDWQARRVMTLAIDLVRLGLPDLRLAEDLDSGPPWSIELADVRQSLRVLLAFRATLQIAPGLPVAGRALCLSDPLDRWHPSDPDRGLAWAGRLHGETDRLLSAVFRLGSEISRRWTVRQAEICLVALTNPELRHGAIAQRLTPAISQQAVSKHLSAAGWPALSLAMQQLETLELAKRNRFQSH